MPALRGKPAMELYRPPTAMRSPGFVAACPAVNGYTGGSPQRSNSGTALNINAKEFMPVNNANDSDGNVNVCNNNSINNNNNSNGNSNGSYHRLGLNHSPARQQPPTLVRSKSSKDARSLKVTFRSGGGGDAPAPSDDATNYNDKRPDEMAPASAPISGSSAAPVQLSDPPAALKRSKSMVAESSSGVVRSDQAPALVGAAADLGHFSPDVQLLIALAMEDPNRLTGRHMMELVRHVFTRLVEAARYGEPAARLCLAVIERERTETFLETLLNTCQEWYQQRDRLLRPHQSTFGNGFVPASPRWIAYITFVNELYALLKRRQVSVGSRPRAGSAVQILLELLAECCQVTLRAPSVNSLAETECVFLILTSIGRDLDQESPGHLERIMAAVRDALINSSLIAAVSKTLLQLVELQAARWQLPAPTVMYYYPMSAK